MITQSSEDECSNSTEPTAKECAASRDTIIKIPADFEGELTFTFEPIPQPEQPDQGEQAAE